MGFFAILLIVALIWLLWPLVRVYRSVRRAQRGFTIDLNDLFGMPGAQRPDSDEPRHRYGWSGLRRKKKKIADDVGEYVRFQEMPADTAKQPAYEETAFATEQQITEVEWDDIR